MQPNKKRFKSGPIHVCHIDDDEGFLHIIAQLLHKISPKTYKITSLLSSEDAFTTINANPIFDIIISDYEMPMLTVLK